MVYIFHLWIFYNFWWKYFSELSKDLHFNNILQFKRFLFLNTFIIWRNILLICSQSKYNQCFTDVSLIYPNWLKLYINVKVSWIYFWALYVLKFHKYKLYAFQWIINLEKLCASNEKFEIQCVRTRLKVWQFFIFNLWSFCNEKLNGSQFILLDSLNEITSNRFWLEYLTIVTPRKKVNCNIQFIFIIKFTSVSRNEWYFSQCNFVFSGQPLR